MLLASYVSVPVSVSGSLCLLLVGLWICLLVIGLLVLLVLYSILYLCCRDVMHYWQCGYPTSVGSLTAQLDLLVHLLSWSSYQCWQSARSHAHAVGVLMLSTMLQGCNALYCITAMSHYQYCGYPTSVASLTAQLDLLVYLLSGSATYLLLSGLSTHHAVTCYGHSCYQQCCTALLYLQG